MLTLTFTPNLYQINLKFISPSAACMHKWIRTALVQITACRIIVAKPLYKVTLRYCQLGHYEQPSVTF